MDTKQYPKRVQEIHSDFLSIGDFLLQRNSLLNKVETLEKLGFINAKEVKKLRGELLMSSDEIEANQYYSNKYPLYKYITDDQINFLCKKHKLVCAPVENYTGFVPLEKLNQIKSAKINDEDLIVVKRFRFNSWIEIILKDLNICAPKKDFTGLGFLNRFGLSFKKLEDPIVILPVKKGNLILAAWGNEASDPLVVNEKMN